MQLDKFYHGINKDYNDNMKYQISNVNKFRGMHSRNLYWTLKRLNNGNMYINQYIIVNIKIFTCENKRTVLAELAFQHYEIEAR